MKRADLLRTLTWLVPVLCFLFAGVLVYLQFKNLDNSRKELAKLKSDHDILQNQIRSYQAINGRERIPFVYDSRLEESLFLESIRRLALETNVDLDRYANQTMNPAPNAPAPAGQPPAMKNVRTLVSALEVRGSYEAVRSFTKQLLSSPRLLAIKSGNWGRSGGSGETVFSFSLHRYVSTSPPPPAQPSAMATTTAGTSP